VLTKCNRMRAVVVSVERWDEVEQALAATLGGSGQTAPGGGGGVEKRAG